MQAVESERDFGDKGGEVKNGKDVYNRWGKH